MSDVSGGSGWWLARDGKWYPPELDPGSASPASPSGTVVPSGSYAPSRPTVDGQMHSPGLGQQSILRAVRPVSVLGQIADASRQLKTVPSPRMTCKIISLVLVGGLFLAGCGSSYSSGPGGSSTPGGRSSGPPSNGAPTGPSGNGAQSTTPGGSWSVGQRIDNNNNDLLNSVSCPTASFCVAVDDLGSEYTYSGGSWSVGQRIDNNNNDLLNSVSCPTASFCVAVDNNGYEFTYSGAK